MRGLETINLGGIAEDVFRPMWATGVFFVFLTSAPDHDKYIFKKEKNYVKNTHM